MYKAHNVALDTNSRSRKLPKRLEDGILLEGAGIRDTSSDYKISLYYPIKAESIQLQPPKQMGRHGSHERWSLQCKFLVHEVVLRKIIA